MHRRGFGRQRRLPLNTRTLLLTISKGKQRLAATNGRTDILNELRELVIVNQAGERRRQHYTMYTLEARNRRWGILKALDAERMCWTTGGLVEGPRPAERAM